MKEIAVAKFFTEKVEPDESGKCWLGICKYMAAGGEIKEVKFRAHTEERAISNAIFGSSTEINKQVKGG